jgi:hypothetical protein
VPQQRPAVSKPPVVYCECGGGRASKQVAPAVIITARQGQASFRVQCDLLRLSGTYGS